MTPQITKLDANTILITTQPATPAPVITTYVYDDLVANLANLKSDLDAFTSAQNVKIAAAQALIDSADGLGVVSKETVAPAAVAENATVIPTN